jgi:tRNA nucleotidyltransferase (CCA-adding enzyme)
MSESPLAELTSALEVALRIATVDVTLDAETKARLRGLDAPEPAEAWQAWRALIREVQDWPAVIATLLELRALPGALLAVRGIPQDSTWHGEGDVLTHLGLAAREAAGRGDVIVLAALLHDVGKATHTVIERDRITSRGHAEAGVQPAREFLAEIGAPREVVERVLPIVREHMAHVSVDGDPSKHAVTRLVQRLAPATLEEWAAVVDADCAGRLPAKPSPARRWLAVQAGFERAPRGARPRDSNEGQTGGFSYR